MGTQSPVQSGPIILETLSFSKTDIVYKNMIVSENRGGGESNQSPSH